MLSITNLLAAIALLLTMLGGIITSSAEHLAKAALYDIGILQPAYKSNLKATLDISSAIEANSLINKRVAGHFNLPQP